MCVCMGGWMCDFFWCLSVCVFLHVCVFTCVREMWAILSGGEEVCVWFRDGGGGAQRNSAAISGMLSACRHPLLSIPLHSWGDT